MYLLTNVMFLATLAGLVGAIRAVLKDENKSLALKVVDVFVGVLTAISVTDYFVPEETPKLAIFVGLIAGSIGAYLIDSIWALMPTLAKGIVEGILGRFGFKKDDEE